MKDGTCEHVELSKEPALRDMVTPTEPPLSADRSHDAPTNRIHAPQIEVQLAPLVDTILQGPNNLLPPLPPNLVLLQNFSFNTPLTRQDAKLKHLAYDTLEDLLWRTVIRANYFWKGPPQKLFSLPASFASLGTAQQRLEMTLQESKRMGRDQSFRSHRAAVEQAVQLFLGKVDVAS